MPPINTRLTPGIPQGYTQAPNPTPAPVPAPPPITASVNLSRDTAPSRPNFQRTPTPPMNHEHTSLVQAWTQKSVPQSRVYSRSLFAGPAASVNTPPAPMATANRPGLVQPDGVSIRVQPSGMVSVNPAQITTRYVNAGVGAPLEVQSGPSFQVLPNSVSPTHGVHFVSTVTPIENINLPGSMSDGGSVTLIATNSGVTTTNTGNIAAATSLVANRPLTFTYSSGKFYPSY